MLPNAVLGAPITTAEYCTLRDGTLEYKNNTVPLYAGRPLRACTVTARCGVYAVRRVRHTHHVNIMFALVLFRETFGFERNPAPRDAFLSTTNTARLRRRRRVAHRTLRYKILHYTVVYGYRASGRDAASRVCLPVSGSDRFSSVRHVNVYTTHGCVRAAHVPARGYTYVGNQFSEKILARLLAGGGRRRSLGHILCYVPMPMPMGRAYIYTRPIST